MRLGLPITLIAAAAMGGCVFLMAQRVRAFYDAQPAAQWHFQQSQSRTFTFKGREVDLQDARMPDGTPALRLRFGDAERLIPTGAPLIENLPELDGYRERVAVLSFGPMDKGEIKVDWFTGQGVRLAIVSRSTAGYDQNTWGAVRVKDWWFDVYELRDDGTITQRAMQFPDRRGRLPANEEAKARAASGESRVASGAQGGDLATANAPLKVVEEIKERSWEWQAALYAIPQTQISRYRFKNDAVDGVKGVPGAEGMRWTLPAAGVSAMAMVGGIVLMGFERVGRRRGPVQAG